MTSSGRTFLVECYLPGIDEAGVARAGERARRAVDRLPAAGREIVYLGATLVAADEAVFHAFRASDVAIVREAARMAELGFERVVESTGVAGDGLMTGADQGGGRPGAGTE